MAFFHSLLRSLRAARSITIFYGLLCLLLPLAVYILILVNRAPIPWRAIGIAVRFNYAIAVPLIAVGLLLAFSWRGRIGRLAALTIAVALFGLALAGLWASGQTETFVISGLLPWVDASSYYRDARRLLEGMSFLEKSVWRPLFPAFLSVLLGISQQNLQIALAILVAVTGFSCTLAAREVQRSHGAAAGVLVFLVLFLYIRRYTGTTLSENMGLIFSSLGFAALWGGGYQRSRFSILAGLFLVTLGLNARPGAFLLLPFLLIWAAWLFRLQGRSFALSFLLQGGVAILAGFLFNTLVLRLVSDGLEMPFSNFFYAFYGLVNGGAGFGQVFLDHPEITMLSGPQHHLKVFELAFQSLLQEPAGIFLGMGRYWSIFFTPSGYSAYSFVGGDHVLIATLSQLGLYLLCLLGLAGWLVQRQDALHALAAVSTLGVVLSVPFVPPIDAFGMRLYAASIPVNALLPALGLSFILNKLRVGFLTRPFVEVQPAKAPAVAGMALAVFLLAGVFWVRSSSRQPVYQPVSCPAGKEAVYFRFAPGTYVNVIEEDVMFLDWLPNFHQGRFFMNIHNIPNTEVIEEFKGIHIPATIFNGLELEAGNRFWLVMPYQGVSLSPGIYGACGRWSPNIEVEQYGFFYAETLYSPGVAGER